MRDLLAEVARNRGSGLGSAILFVVALAGIIGLITSRK